VQHGHAHERTTTGCAGRYESPSDTGAFMPTAQEGSPQGGTLTTQNFLVVSNTVPLLPCRECAAPL
jgi:hypothetical protein